MLCWRIIPVVVVMVYVGLPSTGEYERDFTCVGLISETNDLPEEKLDEFRIEGLDCVAEGETVVMFDG